MTMPKDDSSNDKLDQSIVTLTQSGLPLVPQPYHHLAEQLGVDAEYVMARLRAMQQDGRVRRIGAVPNHYRLGYKANGMSVWDVDDAFIQTAGEKVGQLTFVSHCYERPRAPGIWPYNLFAMVHAHTKAEVYTLVDHIQDVLGDWSRQHDVLFSTRILKKTGFRLGDK